LEELGHEAVALTLPGQGDGTTMATLVDQRDAIVAAVDAAPEPVIVVGHSAASTLAWMAADSRPDRVARVVLIGGFPSSPGDLYADFFEPVDGLMHFPGWAPFAGPESDDLDEAMRKRIEAAMIPVPQSVTRGVVQLGDERRFEVPVTLVCPEFSPDDARAWVASGDVPELARARHVDYVDLATGHWPMISNPAALADVLAAVPQPLP
jgi:pimeloyl-ACP methyl ester carboxylesterase